ncbi:MAG: hypothetical protein AB1430_02195 [Pseudomonadota bacterium]
MSFPSSAAAFALLLATTGPAAWAQNAPAPSPKASAPAYTSAFEGYRRYQDQAVGSWQQANELVHRIGGWQAYAREASEPAQRAPAAPARAASGAPAGGHSGHKHP